MIKHIVMWNIKESETQTKEENIEQAKKMLQALPAVIPQIVVFEVGVNYCTEPTAFDLSLYSAFESEESMEQYKVHPEHVAAATFIKSIVVGRAVTDYVEK